jgi:hypothetical protein
MITFEKTTHINRPLTEKSHSLVFILHETF